MRGEGEDEASESAERGSRNASAAWAVPRACHRRSSMTCHPRSQFRVPSAANGPPPPPLLRPRARHLQTGAREFARSSPRSPGAWPSRTSRAWTRTWSGSLEGFAFLTARAAQARQRVPALHRRTCSRPSTPATSPQRPACAWPSSTTTPPRAAWPTGTPFPRGTVLRSVGTRELASCEYRTAQERHALAPAHRGGPVLHPQRRRAGPGPDAGAPRRPTAPPAAHRSATQADACRPADPICTPPPASR